MNAIPPKETVFSNDNVVDVTITVYFCMDENHSTCDHPLLLNSQALFDQYSYFDAA